MLLWFNENHRNFNMNYLNEKTENYLHGTWYYEHESFHTYCFQVMRQQNLQWKFCHIQTCMLAIILKVKRRCIATYVVQ